MKITLPKFRVAYPKVFEPALNKLSNKMEYSLVALFPAGTNLGVVTNAIEELKAERWGKIKANWPVNIKNPVHKNEERKKVDEATGKASLPPGHDEGGFFINLRSEANAQNPRPGVVDKNVQPIIEPTEFYAGCWAIATVNVFAYPKKGVTGVSPGVSIRLLNLQKVAEGDPLSGKSKAEDDFAPVAGADFFE